jgi:hypothetical protein
MDEETTEPQKTAEELLIPKQVRVIYGGSEFLLKNLSISSIIKLARIIGIRFGRIQDALVIEGISNAEKIEKIFMEFSEDEIIEVIAVSLDISNEDAKKGFKAIDAIRVIRAVFEQEDVDKIFFEIRAIKKSIGMPNR